MAPSLCGPGFLVAKAVGERDEARRRLYTVTALGERALARAEAAAHSHTPATRPRLEPS